MVDGGQLCEGREWQLEQMRKGFLHGNPLIGQFLSIFNTAGRKRLFCGQEINTQQLLNIITFEEESYQEETHRGQPAMTREVLAQLTDNESQLYFRMATGLLAIPPECTITLVLKANSPGVHPTFSTCTWTVS